jgi:hypothetical protein
MVGARASEEEMESEGCSEKKARRGERIATMIAMEGDKESVGRRFLLFLFFLPIQIHIPILLDML